MLKIKFKLSVREDIKKELKKLEVIAKGYLGGKAVNTPQANLGPMFERKAKISCNEGRSVANNLRARQDYIRTFRKTDFRPKKQTSAGLKITFIDMTYPGQRPEVPSLSRHFLLI